MMRLFISLLLVCGLCAGGYLAYSHWSPDDAAPLYRTEPVRRDTLRATVTATGFIEPILKVLVGSQVSGTVTKWYFDFNAEVRAGDVLAELDQERIRATIAQRKAAVLIAEARVEEAKARRSETSLEVSRIASAFDRNAASQFEFDSARMQDEQALAAVQAATASVASAQAELRSAEIELEKTVIRAPIDGIVISRDVDAGQTVAASLQAPTLFTIANDLRRMRVNAAVSEIDIGSIREGMGAEFRVDAYPSRRFQGVVTQVRFAETLLNNVVTYQTLIEVDNEELLLRPGMTATIQLETGRAENVLVVPNAALRFDPSAGPADLTDWRPGRGQVSRPRVFVLNGAMLAEIAVEVGLTDGSSTHVISDQLAEGQSVVVDWDLSGRRAATAASGPRPVRGF